MSYLARPLDEVKVAFYEQRAHAFKCAEKLESNLTFGNPSFDKSMVQSHVYSYHLPKLIEDIVLENEKGAKYDAVYIGKRVGLSDGWKAFALDHKLDDGNALVFELVEATRKCSTSSKTRASPSSNF
ncbi:putative B3 domain-containing protein At5g58280 [Rhododendron vialii]|uniref:putative B3 domain-containing protein At5g58280 n=1 Tax=Rhododendron vialii TaxID=182163 RepID=UPI00265D616A|nr:putative B3 domain-containing protein At5g58280 [Rhododendron vialii]